MDMQVSQCPTSLAERPEVAHVLDQRDTRQRLLQIDGECLPVLRAVQEAVDVIKNVLFGDGLAVLPSGSLQDEVGDAVAAGVFGVGAGVEEGGVLFGLFFVIVEGEALGVTVEVEIGENISHQNRVWFCATNAGDADQQIVTI